MEFGQQEEQGMCQREVIDKRGQNTKGNIATQIEHLDNGFGRMMVIGNLDVVGGSHSDDVRCRWWVGQIVSDIGG